MYLFESLGPRMELTIEPGFINFRGVELNYIHSLKLTRLQLVSKPNYIAFETKGSYDFD